MKSTPLMKADRFLQVKTILVFISFVFIFIVREYIGQTVTFIALDLVLSIYLVSIFNGKYRYLFLIHPVFILFSSYGFLIPFTDIGVGFTYVNTFDMLFDTSLGVNEVASSEAYIDSNKVFWFSKIYYSIIPIIWLPKFLYSNPDNITLYYSMGFFTMLFTALAVYASQYLHILKKNILLIYALYATISPTFLEINSSLHRYQLLFFGLFLFLISYIGLVKKRNSWHRIAVLIFILFASIFFIGLSKPQLLLVLLVFVFIDMTISGKLSMVSSMANYLDIRVLFILIIFLIQAFGYFIIPDGYVTDAFQVGGKFNSIASIPVLGYVVRLVYAVLSPFPWIDFSQMSIYGYNLIFFIMHIFSSFLASWMILTLFVRFKMILKCNYDNEGTIVLFGFVTTFSLMFSSIGFHVYLAPALPFLAVLLKDKYRISIIYPIFFIFFMEIVAQLLRY